MNRPSHSSPLHWLAFAAAGLVLGVAMAAGWQAFGLKTPQPSSRPASSQPVSRPTSTPAIPLDLQAAKAAERLRSRLDGSFNIVVSSPFVVAGNMPADELRTYLDTSIRAPAKAMWASYFGRRPDEVITVLLLADGDSYRAWAKRLFGDTNVAYFGYYRHRQRTLVMNIHTGTGTLVHELTHALIRFDWPDVPTWFNEGLGSLHEQCSVGDATITGLPNWRLSGLQSVIRDGRLPSLAALVNGSDFYGDNRGMNYAHARYFLLYLQHRGLLKRFYQEYRDSRGAPKATPATDIIERVCGEPVAETDRKLRQYVMTLAWP